MSDDETQHQADQRYRQEFLDRIYPMPSSWPTASRTPDIETGENRG